MLLVQNWTIFAVQISATVCTLHSKFQLNRARIQAFKNWLSFSFFFFFLSWHKSYHKAETGYLIALKFGTQKSAHFGMNFG